MPLPRDVARCSGKVYADPMAAFPFPVPSGPLECVDCQRRTDKSVSAFPLTFMSAPDDFPCPYRIKPEEK